MVCFTIIQIDFFFLQAEDIKRLSCDLAILVGFVVFDYTIFCVQCTNCQTFFTRLFDSLINSIVGVNIHNSGVVNLATVFGG